MKWLTADDVRERAARLEIPWSRYGVDPYGVKRDDVAMMMTVLRWLYRDYFTVTVDGIDNIPARGRAMLVGNHSGGWAIDALMVLASCFYEMEPPRLAQGMAEKFINKIPFASMYSYRTGNVTGLPENAAHLLENDRLLLVFPEGARGTAKLYGDRHTLVRFGTGFVRLALETGTPIIPFAFLGGGDAIPTVMNIYKLARRVGMPYIPVTPYLVPVPRPVPLELYYGEPMVFEGDGTEDDDVIDGYVARVKERIGHMIDRGYRRRRGEKDVT